MDWGAILPFGLENLLIGFSTKTSFLFGLKKLHYGADKEKQHFK